MAIFQEFLEASGVQTFFFSFNLSYEYNFGAPTHFIHLNFERCLFIHQLLKSYFLPILDQIALD